MTRCASVKRNLSTQVKVCGSPLVEEHAPRALVSCLHRSCPPSAAMVLETGSTCDLGMRCRGGDCGCLESRNELGRGAGDHRLLIRRDDPDSHPAVLS